jgi:hypothetical protein
VTSWLDAGVVNWTESVCGDETVKNHGRTAAETVMLVFGLAAEQVQTKVSPTAMVAFAGVIVPVVTSTDVGIVVSCGSD